VDYVVFDTDISSLTHKGTLTGPLGARLAAVSPLTFITVGELTKWMEARAWSQRRRDALDRWIGRRYVIWSDETIARIWGRPSAAADRRGRPRPQNDLWIAACCLAEGLPLATRNVKDHEDIVEHHGLVLITD
jgi:predicted nucleic acid-binding protein